MLLDELAVVLRELPNVELNELPRMADFAQILSALDRLHGTHAVQTYAAQADELDQSTCGLWLVSERRLNARAPAWG